jgi:hypothetical protein
MGHYRCTNGRCRGWKRCDARGGELWWSYLANVAAIFDTKGSGEMFKDEIHELISKREK